MLSRRAVLKASVGLCGCAACCAADLSTPASSARSEETHIRGPGYDLRFVGTQRDTITNGRLGPVVDLRTLANTPHLYGIGPIEQLRGEATIIDSRPSLSRVGPNTSILVAENFEAAAPYLVWAEVPAWQTVPIPPEVRSFRDLEAFIPHAARDVGLDPQGPLPLLVHGREDRIEFHILNRIGDAPYSPAQLKQIQFPFELHQSEAIIVGFFSPFHQGIFTPMDATLHVHFQTPSNGASGHISALEIGEGAVLSLPRAR